MQSNEKRYLNLKGIDKLRLKMENMNEFFVLNSPVDITISDEFLGYVIFYRKSKDENIEKIQSELLSKLIQNGLKLKPENFLFIDVKEQSIRISQLKKTISLKKCLLFDVKESEVGINFHVPLYKLISVSNIEFLRSDAPETLEQNKNLKNKLWAQLQLSFKANE